MDSSKITKIENSLHAWITRVYSKENELNPQNLHIDEVETFKEIKRVDWLNDSFFVFKILLKKNRIKKPYVIFLHIDLSDSENKLLLNEITFKWLKNNLNEFTPPSFHCTTFNYYNSFYKKQGIELTPDSALNNLLGDENNFVYLYRTYYDETENMFSRELYIFYNR